MNQILIKLNRLTQNFLFLKVNVLKNYLDLFLFLNYFIIFNFINFVKFKSLHSFYLLIKKNLYFIFLMFVLLLYVIFFEV